MKKAIIIPAIASMIYFTACNSKQSNEQIKLVDKGQSFAVYENPVTKNIADSSAMMIEEKLNTDVFLGLGKKPQPFTNEELPASYKSRKFIKNLAGMTYDIFLIPGNIVKYDTISKDYEFKTLKGIIKNNKSPQINVIDDGILYSSKINSGASFNGSVLIGGLSVATKKIMELLIQDMTKSIVPDSLIDVGVLKKIAESIPAAQRKNYFYIKTATLTYVNNKKYSETNFDAKVNSSYVTAEGKVYATNDKFSRERMVSLDLVSLDNLLSPLTASIK